MNAPGSGQFSVFNNQPPNFKFKYVPCDEDMVVFRADPLNETAKEILSLFDK